MTHEQAVEIAKARHNDRCRILSAHDWNEQIEAELNAMYGFKHGWFMVGSHVIGAHDYAPGPTYSVD